MEYGCVSFSQMQSVTVHRKESLRLNLKNIITFFQHGVFATEDEEYFVEPLWNYTSPFGNSGRLHVVYKRSAIKAMYPNPFCGVKG